MKVTVCVKRVPSTATRIKLAEDGKSIVEDGVEYVLNPYDEFAVEEAIRQVDAAGEGEVTIVTLGGNVTKELRTCLAMGAHRAVHLVQDVPFRDALSVARILAAEIEKTGPDLVLFGRQAVDNDNAQVGLMVATLLNMPAIPDVVALSIANDTARAEREAEGGAREVFEAALPCVLTTHKGLNEPRYPKLKGIMAAKKKPIDQPEFEAPTAAQDVVTLELPPDRPEGRVVGEGAAAVPELLRLLRDEASAL